MNADGGCSGFRMILWLDITYKVMQPYRRRIWMRWRVVRVVGVLSRDHYEGVVSVTKKSNSDQQDISNSFSEGKRYPHYLLNHRTPRLNSGLK